MEFIDDVNRITKIREDKRVKAYIENMNKLESRHEFANFMLKVIVIVSAFNFMYWIANR